jgi:hypothetical protein
VIGGHLADPVKNLPSIFHRGSTWEAFPYLLPNIIVVLFITTSGFLGFLFLEESHPQLRNRPDLGRNISQWIRRKIKGLFGHIDSTGYVALSADESGIPLSSTSEAKNTNSFKEGEDVEVSSSGPSSAISQSPKTSAYTLQVILQILSVSLLAFHKVSSDVIIPTFLATPFDTPESSTDHSKRDVFKFKAGFSMTSPSISNILLTQAIVAIVSQILIVPRVIDRYGPLATFRWSMFAFPWLYCLTPFTARLFYPLSTIAILLDLWIKGVLASLGYVASAIL